MGTFHNNNVNHNNKANNLNQEEKMTLNDYKLKIKKLDEDNEFDYKYINENILNKFRCTKCIQKLIIQIERKEDNILYITSTCKQNHIETKPLMNFWNENKYQITNDFKIYDYVSLNKDKLPDQSYIAVNINLTEIYDICFKCKKIFLLKRQQYDLINHEHNFFKYVLHGYTKDSGTDYYNNNKKDVHLFEYKDQIYLKKKVLEEKNILMN